MTSPSDDLPERRQDMMTIRQQELARLDSIDANNKRLAEATEALILALDNFATKDEVNAKVDAVKVTAVRAEESRTVVVKRVTFGFIVVAAFIIAGMVSTGLYIWSQHSYHKSSYATCLDRNVQTDAFRSFLQTTIQRGSRQVPPSPTVGDLTKLLAHYPAVHCAKSWP